MSVVFYAFGAAALALGFRLRTAIRRHGLTRIVPVLLALAGLSLIAVRCLRGRPAAGPDDDPGDDPQQRRRRGVHHDDHVDAAVCRGHSYR